MARAGMSDEEMTTFLKETFCVDSARTVWDFQRTTLASGVWRTYLPTLRAVPTDAAAPTYLPPALICQVGLPTMKKHTPQRPGGREPESDPSGRIGVSRGDLTDGMVRQTQIDPRDRPCRIHPAGEVRPACPVPRTHFGHHLPYTAPPLPYYHPRAPTSTSPVSDCTVPCHVMVHPRVCVLECPPLGRPSLIKLVLVKKSLLAKQ